MSALQSESSSGGGLPKGWPQRAWRSTSGAWLIDSVPPASTTSAWPVRMNMAAWMTASKPEPQSRLTVRAGTASGTPARRPTWRAR